MSFLNLTHNKQHFESKPSLHLKDNFMTFLEQEKCNVKPAPDAGLPSKEKSNVGARDTCRSWNFNSMTERNRDYQRFHERKHPVLLNASSNASPASSKKQFTCNFVVNNKNCGMKFTTYYQLDKHKTTMYHKKSSDKQ